MVEICSDMENTDSSNRNSEAGQDYFLRPKWDTSKRLSGVVQGYLREEGIGAKLLERRAEALWSTVVGPTVGRATDKVFVKDGVLHVLLKSSMVRTQLVMIKGRIIEELNKAVGEATIKDIRFQ